MTKRIFNLRNVVAIAACLAVTSMMFSGCKDENGDDDENGNGNGTTTTSLETWTKVEIPELQEIFSVGFGDGKFVVGDNKGKLAVSSDNGKTWTVNPNNPWGAGRVYEIIYDVSRFVVVAASETSPVSYTSTPSGTWTRADIGGEDGPYRTIVRAGGYYVVAGYEDNLIYASELSGAWSKGKITPTPDDGETIFSIAHGNGTYVAVGIRGTIAYTTNPGGAWTVVNDRPFDNRSLNGVIFDGTRFVLVGTGNTIGYATNPATWTNKSSTSYNSFFNGITLGKGIYVAVGNNILYTSDPTSNWTAAKTQPFNMETYAHAIAFGNNTFVAVGGSEGKGVIAYATVK